MLAGWCQSFWVGAVKMVRFLAFLRIGVWHEVMPACAGAGCCWHVAKQHLRLRQVLQRATTLALPRLHTALCMAGIPAAG